LNTSIDWDAVTYNSGNVRTSNKRQKIGAVKKHVSTSIQHITPTHTLSNAHKDAITSLIMPMPHIIYSASMDHSIKQFDLHAPDPSQYTSNISCGYHAVTAMDYNADLNLLITGHNDNVIRCWDCRVSNNNNDAGSTSKQEVMKFSLSSHKGWISDVKWRTNGNDNEKNSDTTAASTIHHFASSSYDNTIKLFDIRATVPLHTITSHRDKVLTVEWYGDCILSGGADSQLRSHRIA
jgi:ribosome biogenesis protein YTM1